MTPFSYTDEQAEAMTAEFVAAVGQLEAEPNSPAWSDGVREAAAEVLASHLVERAVAEARKRLVSGDPDA